MPLRNLNGRSGNHSSEGFVLSVGGGIPHDTLIKKGDILDLAPTIFALLGVDKPIQMRGNSLLAKVKDDATFSG
jgi:bisphosphoglycerate-independent phosphoglycerate mutase (AlkP superfamily)